MIDPKTLSDYQDTKQKIREINMKLEEIFVNILRNEEIVTDRPTDYAQHGVVLNIIFDEVNMKAFEMDKLEDLRNLLVEFKALRRKQCHIERSMSEQSSVTKALKGGINSIGGFV